MTTLREIIDTTKDVSQLPFLAEYKRLYEQNDKLIEIAHDMLDLLLLGCVSGEGIDKAWCRDRYNHYVKRLGEIDGVES